MAGRWLHHHHGVRAALNERRSELWTSTSDRLRALLPKALGVLEREIDEGKASLAAAVQVLKACAACGSESARSRCMGSERTFARNHDSRGLEAP
jgi:hypothetical protein